MDIQLSYKKKADKPKKQRRWVRWLIELLIIIVVIAGIRLWQQHGMVSGEAPELMASDLNGQIISLEEYRGKPVLLHFWASWCGICELEMDWISAISNDWNVITVAYRSGSDEEIRRYMARHNIENWVTVNDKDDSIAEHYGVSVMPSTFVIDSHGEIRFKEVGLTTGWGWRIRLWLTDLIDGSSD